MVELPTTLMGRSPSSGTVRGAALRLTSYSNWPILAVPEGRTRLWRASALSTSFGASLGLEHPRVEINHDLPLLAAVGIGNGHAGNGDELGPQEVHAEVEELLLGEPLPGQRELEDGHARGAVVDDEGRGRARRVLAEHGLRDGGDLRVRGVEPRPRLQVDLDDGLAVDGGGLDALDVVHRGREHALVGRGDAPLQLFRVEAAVLPGHRDDRDVDGREDVGGSAGDDHRADDEDQERQDDEGVRAVQGDPDDPHDGIFYPT